MQDKMYYMSVLACFKNEAHILNEWICHYINRGFDHFYLINDHSTDNFQVVLDKFPGKYTLYNNEIVFEKCGRQIEMYRHYSKEAISNSKWLAVMDLDEFLYSPLFVNLKSIFLGYELKSKQQITVDWVHFGSSNRINQPTNVVQSFTSRENFQTFRSKSYYGVKSIVFTQKLVALKIHVHEVEDPTQTVHVGWSTNCNVLLVNHYAIQSLHFWMTVKMNRGDVNKFISTETRNLDMFKYLDNNDVDDFRLARQQIKKQP